MRLTPCVNVAVLEPHKPIFIDPMTAVLLEGPSIGPPRIFHIAAKVLWILRPVVFSRE